MDSPAKMNVALIFLVFTTAALGTEANTSNTTLPAVRLAPIPDVDDSRNTTKLDESTCLVDVYRKDNALWYRYCNGILIRPRWVIVPVFCVSRIGFETDFRVAIHRAEIPVRDIVKPPGHIVSYNDVALLRIGHALVAPIKFRFPDKNEIINGTLLLQTRGRKGEIRNLNVEMQSANQCKHFSLLQGIHICAGDKQNSTVKGQEGSALIKKDPNQDILVGFLSYAHGYIAPAVYSRISRYSAWIRRVIGKTPKVGRRVMLPRRR